jgi:hypothetical protein
MALGDVIHWIHCRTDFAQLQWGLMAMWLRRMCEAAGLRKEDRIRPGGGHVVLEGYYGLRKI